MITIHPWAKVHPTSFIGVMFPEGKVSVGPAAEIGPGVIINAAKYIFIGEKALLGPYTVVYDTGHNYADITRPISEQGMNVPRDIIIGRGSWIGAHCMIMASVGANSVIGANSTVTKDIPDFCMAAGSPAKIIKRNVNGIWQSQKDSSASI